MHYKCFDIEIKDEIRSRDEFNYPERLNFALGVIYDSESGEFIPFNEHQIQDFANALASAKRLVSFNGIKFDLGLIYPHIDSETKKKLQEIEHIDLLDRFFNMTGFRISLDHFGEHTLGVKKLGEAKDAPLLYKQGKIKELILYCTKDVEITKDLYEHCKKQGFLRYFDNFKNRFVNRSFNID